MASGIPVSIVAMVVIMVPQMLINMFGIKLTAWLNDFSVYWHIGGVLAIGLNDYTRARQWLEAAVEAAWSS